MIAQVKDISLDKIKSRDAETLSRLFSEVNPTFLGVLANQGVYGESAKDLVQQAWEQFFTNLDKFEGRSQIKTFLVGILINKIREHRRAVKKYQLEDDSEKFYEASFTFDGWWIKDPEDPERLAENKQLNQLVKGCLEGLGEQQREALVLSTMEEENSRDICNILGVKDSHLRVLVFRAKAKMRECLEGKTRGNK